MEILNKIFEATENNQDTVSIGDQLTPRFSENCIICGHGNTWRFKILDPKNRPFEMCIDCFVKQRVIKPKGVSNVKDSKKEPVGGTKIPEQHVREADKTIGGTDKESSGTKPEDKPEHKEDVA